MFLPFFSKTFRMTIKPLKIAAKKNFISRKINLKIQNLKIIPYYQKKMQIQHDVLFLQFSKSMGLRSEHRPRYTEILFFMRNKNFAKVNVAPALGKHTLVCVKGVRSWGTFRTNPIFGLEGRQWSRLEWRVVEWTVVGSSEVDCSGD